jgi:carbamoyltransferase
MNILGLGDAAGHGVCLNQSLNCRGNLMVYSPTGALNMLYDSDLQFLIMKNILIKKPDAPEY